VRTCGSSDALGGEDASIKPEQTDALPKLIAKHCTRNSLEWIFPLAVHWTIFHPLHPRLGGTGVGYP
jgi:hypothetical protein